MATSLAFRYVNKYCQIFRSRFCIYPQILRNISFQGELFCSESNKKETFPQRVFSGIQPTGGLHLGNYFGAVEKWLELQTNCKDIIFCIADMHSITLPQDPHVLRSNIEELTICLLACGIDPERCILFQQSQVSEHTKLAWVLGCLTTMARLSHVPQWKEKSEKMKEIPVGLFLYPVLQAADVLLYKTTHVPVGEDQAHQLQLTQDLARIFNNKYENFFPIPKTVLGRAPKVKSLRKPDKKMSKSDPDPLSKVHILDSPEIILEKIKKALTDFTSAVTFDPEIRPAVSNLITIHSIITGLEPKEICQQNSHLDTGQYKLIVAEAIIEKFRPVRETMNQLKKESEYVHQTLRQGAERAKSIAEETFSEVQQLVGFKI